jgi:hypothetical protein
MSGIRKHGGHGIHLSPYLARQSGQRIGICMIGSLETSILTGLRAHCHFAVPLALNCVFCVQRCRDSLRHVPAEQDT